jgi:hypothetical protein
MVVVDKGIPAKVVDASIVEHTAPEPFVMPVTGTETPGHE